MDSAYDFCFNLYCEELGVMKVKFFNARAMLAIFVSFVFGILICNYYFTNKVLSTLLVMAFVGVVLLYSIVYRKLSIALVCILTCVIGALSLLACIIKSNDMPQIKVGDKVECVIKTKRRKYDNRFYVKDLVVNDKHIDGMLEVDCTIEEDLEFSEGCYVCFVIESVTANSLFSKDIVNTEIVGDGVLASVKTSEIVLIEEGSTVRNIVREKIRNALHKTFSNENAELMYSTLFGDKTQLSRDMYSRYQSSGVAHVLAVSGLHVGIIVAVLKKLLQKMKVNKYVILIFILSFLIFYAYLCDWSFSVVRASIMAIVVLLAPLFFREYDFLSSISCAGLLILIVNPTALFNASFVLSFLSVLGICLIFPVFTNLLKKLKINNKFTESLAWSLATNLAILIASIYYFKSFNPIGILANIVVLPLFSIIFTCTFLIVFLSLILPFVSYLLYFINPLTNLLNLAINIISAKSYSYNANEIGYISIILWVLVLFFTSRFNVKKGWAKALSILIVLSLFALQIGLKFY